MSAVRGSKARVCPNYCLIITIIKIKRSIKCYLGKLRLTVTDKGMGLKKSASLGRIQPKTTSEMVKHLQYAYLGSHIP